MYVYVCGCAGRALQKSLCDCDSNVYHDVTPMARLPPATDSRGHCNLWPGTGANMGHQPSHIAVGVCPTGSLCYVKHIYRLPWACSRHPSPSMPAHKPGLSPGPLEIVRRIHAAGAFRVALCFQTAPIRGAYPSAVSGCMQRAAVGLSGDIVVSQNRAPAQRSAAN